MKAIKDKNGNISWETEIESYELPYLKPNIKEEIKPEPGRLEAMREKAKTYPQDEEAGS